MNFYIESRSVDPRYNLALEQFVFDSLDRRRSYFMLWQNHSSVIVGKNQNTMAEINTTFVNAHNISVVRRLSGGGAVYHDLGNINYTFIADNIGDNIADTGGNENVTGFAAFLQPVQKALVSFGVPVEITGRNDMTVMGKKFSGNARYIKQGRIMQHGTILYDSGLDMLSKALNVSNDKIESWGVQSVRSRVANIRPYMKTDMSVEDFWAALKKNMFNELNMREYILSAEENDKVESLKEQVYSQWSWNYGASPPHNIRKTRRVEGCGSIEILLDVGKEGVINNIVFYGDFFGNDDTTLLAEIVKGRHFEYNELAGAVQCIDISSFFHNLDAKTFLALLFD